MSAPVVHSDGDGKRGARLPRQHAVEDSDCDAMDRHGLFVAVYRSAAAISHPW